MEKKRNKILLGKPGGKRSLGRPTYQWEDYIKMDFRQTEWGGVF
jgi:hypothetical protein